MAFTPRWTSEALAAYNRLQAEAQESLQNRQKNKKTKATKAEGLFKQAHKSVALLVNNPRHPGLHTHPYDSIPNPYDSKQRCLKPTRRTRRRARTGYSGATGQGRQS